jgi:hypothetical protein
MAEMFHPGDGGNSHGMKIPGGPAKVENETKPYPAAHVRGCGVYRVLKQRFEIEVTTVPVMGLSKRRMRPLLPVWRRGR